MMHNPLKQAEFDSLTYGHNWAVRQWQKFFYPWWLMGGDSNYG